MKNLNVSWRIEAAQYFDPIFQGGIELMKLLTIVVLTSALALSAIATPGNPQKPEKAQAVRITDGPRVEGVGPTWAVIAWTTNTGGSSVVRYGTDANNLSQTAKSS
ncbi:MAG TPA: hypothetical protein VGQ12_19015, partial [Candidatus Angelobacter sp.]|nr:hypothetical protein [Candidatus Angelobacter sp.]